MRQRKPTSPYNFKAVLLGDSGVGKTSIVNRWMTGACPRDAADGPTVGANHQTKRVTIAGHEIELFVWDTAGQEQYRSLAPLYARGAAVAILTASITDRDSFEHLDRWIDTLNSSTETTPPIILAVNKCDVRGSAAMSQDEVDDTYRDRFAGLFFVSALQDLEIDNLFIAAAEAGYRFALANQRAEEQLLEQLAPDTQNCPC
jgi:small GTP-binding protein